MLWRVEVRFPTCDFSACLDRTSEETTLHQMVDIFLDTDIVPIRLRMHSLWTERARLRILLKTEGRAGGPQYRPIDNMGATLRDVLAGRTVVEFPTFVVGSAASLDQMPEFQCAAASPATAAGAPPPAQPQPQGDAAAAATHHHPKAREEGLRPPAICDWEGIQSAIGKDAAEHPISSTSSSAPPPPPLPL